MFDISFYKIIFNGFFFQILKYGLDDSDEDDNELEKKKETKKLKTLQLREQPQQPLMEVVTVHAEDLSPQNSKKEPQNQNLTSPMEETFQKISDCSSSNRDELTLR